ncbi:MAG: hypothetical protein VB009_08085 [Erysipelotrichaceae bacterium]|nr:hypothetical protein [Erysipelotrichaceae bacterium]
MRVRHRIAYNKESVSKDFIAFLLTNNARFDNTNSFIGVAYIFEKEEYLSQLSLFYQKEKITPIIDVVYTQDEYDNTLWLSFRPKFRFEYPQPEDESKYKTMTYDGTKFCDNCGSGLVQKDSFRIAKSPKWGKRHFLMLNWIEDEIFINTIAKEFLVNNKIKGLDFLEVMNHKKNLPFEDIHQIYVKHKLNSGLINFEQSVKATKTCNLCGTIKYVYSGKGLTFKKEIFEGIDLDIFKTDEFFGAGHICARIVIISQKLYQLIKSSGMDKDIEFEPITLV